MMQNGLSVDVEDWFQVGAFERTIGRGDWDGLECRVEANCDAVLQLFGDAGAKATSFTLGISSRTSAPGIIAGQTASASRVQPAHTSSDTSATRQRYRDQYTRSKRPAKCTVHIRRKRFLRESEIRTPPARADGVLYFIPSETDRMFEKFTC